MKQIIETLRQLKPSTIERRDVLRKGIAMWDSRA